MSDGFRSVRQSIGRCATIDASDGLRRFRFISCQSFGMRYYWFKRDGSPLRSATINGSEARSFHGLLSFQGERHHGSHYHWHRRNGITMCCGLGRDVSQSNLRVRARDDGSSQRMDDDAWVNPPEASSQRIGVPIEPRGLKVRSRFRILRRPGSACVLN